MISKFLKTCGAGMLMLLLCQCQTMRELYSPPKKHLLHPHQRWGSLKEWWSNKSINSSDFYSRGPFEFTTKENLPINLSLTETLKTDLIIPKIKDKSPLVVFVHGNGFTRLAHRKQGLRLASWGYHVLLLDVPKFDQWIKNGDRIYRLIKMLESFPNMVGKNWKGSILAGHSFGGSAVTIAAAKISKLKKHSLLGLILLDPAQVHKSVVNSMSSTNVPSILLGADRTVFRSRFREHFFRYLRGPIAEVSIVGSTHNDAQFPSINTVHWGFDPFTEKEFQESFQQKILLSATSIALTGKIDLAWEEMKVEMAAGKIKNGRVRFNRKTN